MPLKTIFISYSHKDELLKDELVKHLHPFEMTKKAKIWHDGMIGPGILWDKTIKDNLEKADIVLLLVSSDALTSEYINNVEIKKAMARNRKGENIVIPVVLRPCNWTILPIGNIQALPKGGKAISTWSNQDEAYVNVVKGLEPLLK